MSDLQSQNTSPPCKSVFILKPLYHRAGSIAHVVVCKLQWRTILRREPLRYGTQRPNDVYLHQSLSLDCKLNNAAQMQQWFFWAWSVCRSLPFSISTTMLPMSVQVAQKLDKVSMAS
jgi:hypothetical protein